MPSVVLGRGIIGKWNLCVISSDPPMRGGRATTSISSPKHILINFSSEPHRNPRPFNNIFLKCPILENKYIFKNMATLGHR